MRLITHLGRSMAYHWRSHLAVALGVVTASATLTGALLVGDSMRTSLRDVALARLGQVDHALVSGRFFRQKLATELAGSATSTGAAARVCPVIQLSGGIVHAETGARVNRITVFGADEGFWLLAVAERGTGPTMPPGRSVLFNEPLAAELGASLGDDVLVRLGKPNPVSSETLLGRRDDTTLTLRLTVRGIISADCGGGFALKPGSAPPNNAWVPLATVQSAFSQPDRVNTILVESTPESGDPQRSLREHLELTDLGLRLRIDRDRGYIALESDGILLEPAVERAALAAAASEGIGASPILTYLANTISAVSSKESASAPEPSTADYQPSDNHAPTSANPQSSIPNRQSIIPYSTVTALDTAAGSSRLRLVDKSPAPPLERGDILLNQWAAADLGANIGEPITLTYYVTGSFGQLETRRDVFVLRGIVRMDAAATDPGFAPPYPGVTDTENLADWDPPFPIDFALIRDKDEDYWDRHTTAPKAFISLGEGRYLWTHDQERFGQSTSLRLSPKDEADLDALAGAFDRELRRHLDPAELGLAFEPVRERALQASTGTTDFGMLFVAFSFFLILSAAMLVALLFRLGVERRAAEVGVLLATGFSARRVTGMLVIEGAVVACLGAAAGLIAALGYAWLMLAGLKSWWAGAVNAPFLQLHAPTATLGIGFGVSLAIAIASIAWSIRKLSRCTTRTLLAGVTDDDRHASPRTRQKITLASGLVALAIAGMLLVLPAVTGRVSQTLGFFGGGAALVVACLCAIRAWLHLDHRTMVQRASPGAILRLGINNAPRHPGRSLLTAGLIASATFIIAAIGAMHVNPDTDTTDRDSPTGGFALLGEAAIPLPYDLNTPPGRDSLGLTKPAAAELNDVTVVPFRLRPGDETSCRGLYRPTKPRIIGAPDRLIDRGGFVFASTLAQTDEEKANPWTLLRRTFPDGAVPVIGDESAVKWQLHLDLGKDLLITDERGLQQRLRFVALLDRSALQDELIVAESRFVRLFPSINGHAFFLMDVPPARASAFANRLERELSPFAVDVTSTTRRLTAYSLVQNTYLKTFQTLGGLGLVLGTVGLTVVLLRNIVERRSELALMQALGFLRATIGRMVLAENAFLVVAGLVAGAGPALIAIAPHLLARPAQVPWLSLGLTLLAVLAVGVGSGALVLIPTLRAPLLPALRSE